MQSTASGSALADSGFTFGRLRPRSNAITIDGLDNTDETTGAARIALSPEIVREFQIVNGGLQACGHLFNSKLETTQVYAESTTEMIKESYRKALAE